MRKLLLAAAFCGVALAAASSVQARGLTTTPNDDGAMLIPTYSGTTAHVIPVQYWRHHHREWHHRRYWHRHYR